MMHHNADVLCSDSRRKLGQTHANVLFRMKQGYSAGS